MPEFETLAMGEGIALHRLPVERFKSVTCRAVFHLPLGPEAAEAALVPQCLRRGTRAHPDLASIGRKLDDLYGAALDGDVSRTGERQVVDLAIDLVAPRHLPGRADVLREGLGFLREMLVEPRLEGERFPDDVFDQERENLARVVDGLVDDRVAYATERCLARMCEGEPYANYPLGTAESIRATTNERVVARWRTILRRAPLDVYAVGPGDEATVEEEVRRLAAALGARAVEVPPESVSGPERPPRRFSETMEIEQGKLVLGFRTEVRRGRKEDAGLSLFATILGGGPFSRLFRTVREEHALAYYASASLERAKGLLLVHAGIDPANEQAVVDLALDQVERIRRGEIREEEMAAAKRAIRLRLRGLDDSPSGRIAYALERSLLGRSTRPESEAAAVAAADPDEVAEAGSRIRLDTIFSLRPEGKAA